MKENNKNGVQAELEKGDFKGYTMEELRYQRALMALRKEFSKQKVLKKVDEIRNPGKGDRGDCGTSKLARVGNIAAKIFSNLNYLDYALVGLSLFGTGRKLVKMIGTARKKLR